ncbi:MAG: hypothetical protein V3T05_06585 [Myxococcota bacterium]
MNRDLRIHAAAAGLLALIATTIILFWTYPRLLVYILLAIVAALAYGALYLILAAWMDPKDLADRPPSKMITKTPPRRRRRGTHGSEEPTITAVEQASGPRSAHKKRKAPKSTGHKSKARTKSRR